VRIDPTRGAGARNGAGDIARRLRRREQSPLVIALAALLVVALIALVVVAWQWRSAAQRYTAEADARDVAEQRTEQILTWKAATLDSDAGWAEDGATESFRADYATTLDGVRETYGALGASSVGSVLTSSPRADSDDEVEVTVFAQQRVAQSSGEETCVLSSVVWTMVRSDGTWLVDGLSAPGAPIPVTC
jgi:hypothetical protein